MTNPIYLNERISHYDYPSVMKVRYHIMWILGIFMFLVAPMFYVLYAWGYLPSKNWNLNSNHTECLIVSSSIVSSECEQGIWWRRPQQTIGEVERDGCYDGHITLWLMKATNDFDVAHGSFRDVNQTLCDKYPIGSCIGCWYQITNTSDFDIKLKDDESSLILAIALPGSITVLLVVWGLCAVFSTRHPHYEIVS